MSFDSHERTTASAAGFDTLRDVDRLAVSLCARLGVVAPLVTAVSPQRDTELGQMIAAVVAEGRFFAFVALSLVGPSYMVVNPTAVAALPRRNWAALVAHEAGHAADPLDILARTLLRQFPAAIVDPVVRLLDARSERFANRVAAHLVGTSAMRDLYESATACGGVLSPLHLKLVAELATLPERPSLPFSARLRRTLARLVDGKAGHRP